MDTMKHYFPLQVLQAQMIDRFPGYDKYIGEKVLVIPGGCGGMGYDVRRLDSDVVTGNGINQGLITVSRGNERAENGRERSLPRAYPHEVIPLDCINDWIDYGLDLLNECKDRIREENQESHWDYQWRNDPSRELWTFIYSLAEYSGMRFDDRERWQEFRNNGDISYGQKET